MKGLNKVLIIGALGQAPKIHNVDNGSKVVNISVATNESWKDKSTGEKRESTEWHNVVFFGKIAEIAAEYLKKGSQVYIEGRLQTRKWQDKQGNDRYTTEIVANEMQMLGGRPRNDGAGQSDSAPTQRPAPAQVPQTEGYSGSKGRDVPF